MCALADRHYSRQAAGSDQCVPPGFCVVLRADDGGGAAWVSLRQRHVDHAWKQAWVCTLFRNEGAGRSSDLVLEAVAATRWIWPGALPADGFVTFVRPDAVRHKRDPGRCFRRAGFRHVATTIKGLLVLQLGPAAPWPAPAPPLGATAWLQL